MDIQAVYLLLPLALGIIFIARTIERRASKLPPGPWGLPVIGSLHRLGAKPHQSLAQLAGRHGPIMSLKLGQVTAVVISSAPAARLVLQKQDHSFANRAIPDSISACGHDEVSVVWRPVSPRWRELRRICVSEIFSCHKMEACGGLRRDKVHQMVRDVSRIAALGEPVLIGEAAFRTMLSLISCMVLSVDVADGNSKAAAEFKKSFSGILELAGVPNSVDYFPWLRMIDPQRIRARMAAHFEKILRFTDSMIDERMRQKKLDQEQGSVSENRDVLDTLVDILLHEHSLTKKEANHLMLELFVAGTDTTSSTVEWAMSEALRSPRILSRAKAELVQVTGKGGRVEEKDIPRLPYLQAIVKETMRMHPPAPLLVPRTTLAQVDLGGFTIPKGAQIMVNVWAIGRDPGTWDSPERFEPERFLGSDVDMRGGGGRFELVPFGGGRRMCPGIPLASRMIHLMLGSLIHSFDWKLEGGAKMEDIDMDDKFGLSLQKARPLRAVPLAPL
uniref:Cytochrome P450 n=1 Tax=Kalanchoe fedtschenkoi TaxID=63787 RepID=A0A7N0V7C3_KALFE